jgi:hypothetical protein
MSNQSNYVKSILLGQLLLEANDQLKGTNRYKQNVKNQLNKVNLLLEPIAKAEFDKIYDADPEMVTNILNKMEALIDKIKGSSIEDLVIIDAVIDKYMENKEWFENHVDAEFLKLN